MTFTTEEEEILKLIVAEMKARMKLNIENQIMGNLIRTEFKTIDEKIRTEHASIFIPLEKEVKTAQENLRKRFE